MGEPAANTFAGGGQHHHVVSFAPTPHRIASDDRAGDPALGTSSVQGQHNVATVSTSHTSLENAQQPSAQAVQLLASNRSTSPGAPGGSAYAESAEPGGFKQKKSHTLADRDGSGHLVPGTSPAGEASAGDGLAGGRKEKITGSPVPAPKECDDDEEPPRVRRPTYTTIKNSPFMAPSACSHLVKLPNVIVMVGLPARGKTFISSKLCRYLNWIGIRTKVFNVGEYRRNVHLGDASHEFFSPRNQRAQEIRRKCADLAMDDVSNYLEKSEGEVAIFDATNSTRERRTLVLDAFQTKRCYRVLFIESICDDQKIIETNIADVKVNSPDYRNMDRDKARDDFVRRIDQYRTMYEPLDDVLDCDLSYIQVFNAGRSFFVNNIQGHVQSRVVYFLMNIHLMPRTIYMSRHGESEFNRMGRIGGDAPLSESGLRYADQIARYFTTENVADLRVWTSRKIRTVQTAYHMKNIASFIENWKALDEIDAGICEGLTYEEIQERYPEQFAIRDQDKYHYRYPSGESYEDLVARLEPVIMELERQENVLVVSHQAVLRCLLAYFLDKNPEELPYLRVPLHSVIKLTPVAYGCNMDVVRFHIDAVDTHRDKPPTVSRDRTADEALSTVPPYPDHAEGSGAGDGAPTNVSESLPNAPDCQDGGCGAATAVNVHSELTGLPTRPTTEGY
jgi:broad specificity phosphatase PhoE/adenylylsulfate kinase-like enzyme